MFDLDYETYSSDKGELLLLVCVVALALYIVVNKNNYDNWEQFKEYYRIVTLY